MRNLHKNHDGEAANTFVYNAAINAWASSQDQAAVERSMELLNEMETKHQIDPFVPRPDTMTYNFVYTDTQFTPQIAEWQFNRESDPNNIILREVKYLDSPNAGLIPIAQLGVNLITLTTPVTITHSSYFTQTLEDQRPYKPSENPTKNNKSKLSHPF